MPCPAGLRMCVRMPWPLKTLLARLPIGRGGTACRQGWLYEGGGGAQGCLYEGGGVAAL